MTPKLFRVILPVSNIDRAAAFYGRLLGMRGERVSSGRHYFDCQGTVLACYDPRADGDAGRARPNPEHIYFAVADLNMTFARARSAGGRIDSAIATKPWGERSFYATDPFGNHLCFVDQKTAFTGHRPRKRRGLR